MLVPDPTNLMAGPCQEAAVGLRRKWQKQMESNAIIPDLQIQLYQWSIEGKGSHASKLTEHDQEKLKIKK